MSFKEKQDDVESIGPDLTVTNEKILRDILNRNPMTTGDEVIPEELYGRLIVDWNGADDPEMPQNWAMWRRFLTTVILALSTASMSIGAAIVTPIQTRLEEKFDTTRAKTGLDVTLFLWGFGLGSLWFTPMSEIPVFRGRKWIYFGCQLLFAIMQIPLGLSNHLGGFAVLRLLSGIFAAPAMSTVPGSISDLWTMPHKVLALIIWSIGSIAGPYIGPLIGAGLTLFHPVSYVFWFLLAASGGILIFMLVFLRETSAQELLRQKAVRLRKETGNDRYIAEGEILMQVQTGRAILKQMFLKPLIMVATEPILLLIDVHLGLVYTCVFLFIEAMPIVYLQVYHFNTVQMGLAFIVFLVGTVLGAFIFTVYSFMNERNFAHPERIFGLTAVIGAILFPSGLLLWGWLSRDGICYWIGFIGLLFFQIGSFFIFQSYFAIMGALFPPYSAGSAFASNTISRAMMAGSSALYGTVLYEHTAISRYPVGWGCTILTFIGLIILPLPIYLMVKGKSLREKTQRKYAR